MKILAFPLLILFNLTAWAENSYYYKGHKLIEEQVYDTNGQVCSLVFGSKLDRIKYEDHYSVFKVGPNNHGACSEDTEVLLPTALWAKVNCLSADFQSPTAD